MKLSTKGRYGLRAYIDLAKNSGKGPVSIGSIAARQDISERYLEQLMAKLKKAGLVKSVRGAGGGYGRPPDGGCLGDVGRKGRPTDGETQDCGRRIPAHPYLCAPNVGFWVPLDP